MKKVKKKDKISTIREWLLSKIKKIYKKKVAFKDSESYWIDRYNAGGNSGEGSYDKYAEFKADIINKFVAKNKINKVIEFGCGDGNQLKYFKFNEYVGYDISSNILNLCREIFKNDITKRFDLIKEYSNETADLTLSMDVIYHLVEDNVFNDYMNMLFQSSTRYVIIYSSNTIEINKNSEPHVKHRKFSSWIETNKSEFELIEKIKNQYPHQEGHLKGSYADFYIYYKK